MVKFIPLVLVLLALTVIIGWPKPGSELTSKDFLEEVYSATGKFDPTVSKAVWFNQEAPQAPKDLAAILDTVSTDKVLGDSNEEKWIEVDLSEQKLYAIEGNRIVYEFPISSGLPSMPTVTGEFRIWGKIKAQRMTGGSVAAGTFYDLPNVPFVQYFYKGYSLHGAYWHNDFGKPRSHGCVNLSIPAAEQLFYWTNPVLASEEYSRTKIAPTEGTRVVVHGTTPTNIN
jgi:lipoprotein-anchoring transpeptidase ErfK/SrfK